MARAHLPNHSTILAYWSDNEAKLINDVGFFLDIGEPACWACGYNWWGRYNVTQDVHLFSDSVKAWQKAPLERCHIVPSALGGTNLPENIIFMCSECHEFAPNTIYKDMFLSWSKRQNWAQRRILRIKEELQAFGIDMTDELMDLLGKDFIDNDKSFLKWTDDKISLHWSRLGHPLTAATIAIALIKYLENSGHDVSPHEKGI